MNILASHILFLSLGIFIINFLRKEKFIGLGSVLISLVSLTYVLYIVNMQDSLINQKIDLIISLVVPRQIIEKRIIGRVTCDKCNLTLNEFFNEDENIILPK